MKKIVSREALYQQVWQKPIIHLAKEYGISDTGLAKLCRRHLIPLPGRGYWAKLAYNKPVKQTPLPVLNDEQAHLTKIRVEPEKFRFEKYDKEKPAPSEFTELLLFDYSLLPIEESLPLSLKTYRHLVKAKLDERHYLFTKKPTFLDIYVSKASLERAIQLFDVILRVSQIAGWKVEIDEEHRETKIVDGIDSVSIGLDEKFQRIPYKPTEQEEKRVKRDPYYHYKLPQYDYLNSGLLTFQFRRCYASNLRKTWSDGKVQRLEACLQDIVLGIAAMLKYKKESRNRHEEEQKVAKERRLRWKVIESEQKMEREKVSQLNHDYDNWVKAGQLRAFIDSLKGMPEKEFESRYGSGYIDWSQWAIEQADRLDPLKKSPVSILDIDIPEHHHSWW